MSHEHYLLQLQVSPSLEEAVVDCLLSLDKPPSFSSHSINAHHGNHHQLSAAEQVTGRQRKISFTLLLDKAQLATVLNAIKQAFTGSGLEYSVLPVIEVGVV